MITKKGGPHLNICLGAPESLVTPLTDLHSARTTRCAEPTLKLRLHPTQVTQRTKTHNKRNTRNARIDTASIFGFWPLRRLHQLRVLRLLRAFLAFMAFVAYLLPYVLASVASKRTQWLCVACVALRLMETML